MQSHKQRSGFDPLVAVCVVLLLPSLLMSAGRFLLPTDSATLDMAAGPADGQGLNIGESGDPLSRLRTGDQLLAINGQPVNALLGVSRPTGAGAIDDDLVRYRVRRGSRTLELAQPLSRADPTVNIAANWPSFLFVLYLELVAVFVYVRRPQLATARVLLLYASLTLSSGLVFFLGLHPVDLLRGWPYAIFVWSAVPLFGLAMAGVLHFLLMFPKRRPVLDRYPWIVGAVYLSAALLFVPPVAIGWARAGTSSARLILAMRTTGLFDLGYPVIGLLLLLHGYLNRFNAGERRQTRWVLWGGVMVAIPWLGLSVVPDLLGYSPLLSQFAVGLVWLILPSALAIAIVRESLFDIDRIINRTLVYASLTVVLVAMYFATVVALQQLFDALTGQRTPLAIVLSTLVIAAMFNPLRTRIQRLIDQRFFRRRYNADQALRELSVEMQRQVDLADLSQSILNLVINTLQPRRASLWLRRREPPR